MGLINKQQEGGVYVLFYWKYFTLHFYERKGFKDADSLLLIVSQGNIPNRTTLFPNPDVREEGVVSWSGSSCIWSNRAREIANLCRIETKITSNRD